MPRTRRRGDRGAAAVEFALVLPLLITLLFGMIDFGFAINRYTVINNATREGVRAASLSGTQSDVEKVVKDALSDLPGTVTVTVSCTTPKGATCSTWDGGKATGGVATVTATYQHSWITPIGSTFSPNLTLSKSSQMRIE